MALVSALCLTRGRVKYLNRAIKCFQRQSWQTKQLVIVYDEDDEDTVMFLKNNIEGAAEVKLVGNTKINATVGFLRNLAVNAADGEFCIQWDDDDYYSPDRITYQMTELKQRPGKFAILLDAWFIYYEDKNKAIEAAKYGYEGTILATREALLRYPYPDVTRTVDEKGRECGEDTFVIRKLQKAGYLATVHYPMLYIYCVHSDNTCNEEHFKRMYNAAVNQGNKPFTPLNVKKWFAEDDASLIQFNNGVKPDTPPSIEDASQNDLEQKQLKEIEICLSHYTNTDAYPSKHVEEFVVPFVSLEKLKPIIVKVFAKYDCGGFVVFRNRVYFKLGTPEQLTANKKVGVGCDLYIINYIK